MKRKKTEIRKVEIVDSAMNIIAHKGVKKFTAQLIADEIGVTAGAIFRHFPNMDEIINAVIDRIEEILFEDFPPKCDTPFEQLEQFFHKRVALLTNKTALSQILLSEHLLLIGSVKASIHIKDLKKRSQRFVKKCLQESIKQKLISDEISPETMAIIILGSILSIGHSSNNVASKHSVKKLSQEVWQALQKMLSFNGDSKKK